jgi:hypothetical protein
MELGKKKDWKGGFKRHLLRIPCLGRCEAIKMKMADTYCGRKKRREKSIE